MEIRRPITVLIREGTIGDCPKCHSTQVRKYLSGTIFNFGKKIGCIQPKCENYYLNNQRLRNNKINKILK